MRKYLSYTLFSNKGKFIKKYRYIYILVYTQSFRENSLVPCARASHRSFVHEINGKKVFIAVGKKKKKKTQSFLVQFFRLI